MNTYSKYTTRSRGFTLIEVVIVIAIIAIIAAIAIPSYSSYMNKTRRIDATALLSEIAGEQQRFFTENNRYATELTEMGYPADTQLSENGFYSASVSASAGTSFTLIAAPVAGEAQENDTDCGSFTINSVGLKGVEGATLVADQCW